MNEQQQFNLARHKELGKSEMSKEVAFTLNGMRISAFIIFRSLFTSPYALFTDHYKRKWKLHKKCSDNQGGVIL